MKYSVVIPVYNEATNILILIEEIKKVMEKLGSYEIIIVDDGSTDGTDKLLERVSGGDIKVIFFRRNFGQSSAFDAGFKNSSGDIIITIDGDRQNNPKDIPLLLAELDKGYDCISGWRWKRNDSLSKRLMSKIASKFKKLIIKSKLNDSGCSLKAFRKECLEDFRLDGEMHRYIAESLQMRGFKISEVKVSHRPRNAGSSKYNFKRIFRGFFDLLMLFFWGSSSSKLLYIFCLAGLFSLFIGISAAVYLVYNKIFFGIGILSNYLLIFSIIMIISGFYFFALGFILEGQTKNYYKDKSIYSIKKILR